MSVESVNKKTVMTVSRFSSKTQLSKDPDYWIKGVIVVVLLSFLSLFPFPFTLIVHFFSVRCKVGHPYISEVNLKVYKNLRITYITYIVYEYITVYIQYINNMYLYIDIYTIGPFTLHWSVNQFFL